MEPNDARVSAWKDLIADLENDCKTEAPVEADNIVRPLSTAITDSTPLLMAPLFRNTPEIRATKSLLASEDDHNQDDATTPLSVLFGDNTDEGRGRTSRRRQRTFKKGNSPPGLKRPPPSLEDYSYLPRTLPCTISLRKWMNYHRRVSVSTTSNVDANSCSWRSSNQGSNKVNKYYLEQAAHVALSLASKLEEHSKQGHMSLIHERDIQVDNLVVINTASGETEFIQTSRTNSSGRRNSDNERREIYSLGKVFYEIFTQSSSSSTSLPLSSSVSTTRHNSPTFISSFEEALGINVGDSISWNSSSNSRPQQHHSRCDYELHSSQNQGSRSDARVRNMLDGEGLPSSLVRLIANMLKNEDDSSRSMICNGNAITWYSDLILDLKEMVDNPTLFLHDSLLRRCRPAIVENKLYCRDGDMRIALEVADRVLRCGGRDESNEAEFNSSLYYLKVQEVLMVSGHSGIGKSTFVQELSSILERKGWRYLHCKFDRVHHQPLSCIISAFDQYFAKLIADSKRRSPMDFSVGNEQEGIRKRILKSIREDNVSILCQLIPSMRQIMSKDGTFCEREAQIIRFDGRSFDFSDAMASESRLHHIFGLLVKAISQKPVMFFLDDLHWADKASLDLISALMGGIGEEVEIHEDGLGMSSNGSGSGVLFVGAYRANEAGPLATSLCQVQNLCNVRFTEIVLNGLSCDDVSLMVSEALCCPQRLSRNLSDLIHKRSTGNPLFVREFLNELDKENLLNYSLSSHMWEWDDELIESRTNSDGVAELLRRKLLRLPKSLLSALRVLSIFGSEVSIKVLNHVRYSCGSASIISQLDRAVKEGFIKKTAEKYSFVHDIIGQSVQSGVNSNEWKTMSTDIAEALLAGSAENREDSLLFIIVDLINRADPEGVSTVDRMRHASLNLTAAEKAIQTPDFESASMYLESGIAFLDDDYWTDSYNLALHLFKNSAFVQCAQGNMDLMKERLDEVLENARCFEDKLDTLNLMIHSSTIMASGVGQAFEQSFSVLEQLGESFPTSPDNKTIANELFNAKNQLEQYRPSAVSKLQPINNLQKAKAMEILPALMMQCYQQKSPLYPLVGCRMTKITLQYGIHENSALGFCGLALAYTIVFKDVSEGYKLGKYALAITTNKNIPAVHMTLGMISIWKEPIQALLPELLNAYNMGLQYGRISQAVINSMLYAYQALLSGSNLCSLAEEVSSFHRQYTLCNQNLHCMSLEPISNAIMSLTGRNISQKQDTMAGYNEKDLIIMKFLEQKELALSEGTVVCQLMHSFIFKDLDKAEKLVRQHFEFFKHHGTGMVHFVNIYHYFYSGLIAFNCYRKTQDQFWMDIGAQSVSKFEKWTNECEWNFQNKLLLLQAEQHFSAGNIAEAGFTYNSAISSSRDHRFVHEEAIAIELASYYYSYRGKADSSKSLMHRAIGCYASWGAHEKAEALRRSWD